MADMKKIYINLIIIKLYVSESKKNQNLYQTFAWFCYHSKAANLGTEFSNIYVM